MKITIQFPLSREDGEDTNVEVRANVYEGGLVGQGAERHQEPPCIEDLTAVDCDTGTILKLTPSEYEACEEAILEAQRGR